MTHLNKALFILLLVNIIVIKKVNASKNFLNSDSSVKKSGNKSEILNSKVRLTVPKCCKVGEVVSIGRKISNGELEILKSCKKFRGSALELNFSKVPLYDDSLSKTERFLTDIFEMEDEKFNNETFKSKTFHFPGMNHRYYLTESGTLYREQPNELRRWHFYDKDNFCIDYLSNKRNKTMLNFWTVENFERASRTEFQENLMTIGLLISCAFLCLTLLVYLILPELRNLGGLILMAYVISLFNAFLFLALLKLYRFGPDACARMTYTTYFFFLSSFSWMNIMSCDIWWTFRGYAKARPIHRRGEPFKFMIYCLYGFGMPLALTIAMYVIENVDMRHLPWFVTPNLKIHGCFLGGDAKLVYLYGPMFIMIICNWIFFLMTAFNIWRLHRDTKVLDTTASGAPAAHRKQQARLLIYLKLSIIMGINWLLEVISSFQPEEELWYISDIYNILIGLSIFLIFVFKKKIFEKVCKRCRGFSESVGGWRRSHYSMSHSSQTTESEVTQDTPLVCISPKGQVYIGRQRSKEA